MDNNLIEKQLDKIVKLLANDYHSKYSMGDAMVMMEQILIEAGWTVSKSTKDNDVGTITMQKGGIVLFEDYTIGSICLTDIENCLLAVAKLPS